MELVALLLFMFCCFAIFIIIKFNAFFILQGIQTAQGILIGLLTYNITILLTVGRLVTVNIL